MPAPMTPPHDLNLWTMFFSGGGLVAVVTGGWNYLSKAKERAAAKDKIEADAAAGREKIEADALLAKEKIGQEALLAKEARVEEGVWKLIQETREHAEKMRADSRAEIEAMSRTMSLRIDGLTEEVATQKERAGMAEVLTSVANLRADDADADRRKLKADLSLAMVQIETLQRELADRDSMDHRRQRELAEMREKLQAAQSQLDSISQSNQ